jgi:protein-tyrosine phosphatase
LAEAIFNNLVKVEGLSHKFLISSAAAKNWHIGKEPDKRTQEIAQKHGIVLTDKVKKFDVEFYDGFDLVVVMDERSRDTIMQLTDSESNHRKICLLREFDPDSNGQREIPDPFYGTMETFEEIYQLIYRCCKNLLNHEAIKNRIKQL